MQHIGRRDFLTRSAGAVIGSTALGAALSACGTSSGSGTAGGTPRRGGTLRAGLTGGGTVDTLNPLTLIDIVAGSYAANLYDGLIAYDAKAQPIMRLAREITSNADATVWTIRLRPGVTWHDGKPLTADDVIHTFRTILDPKNPQVAAPLLAPIVVNRLRKRDTLTVEVPLSSPYSTFSQCLAVEFSCPVVQDGFDPKKPNGIGTGPFKFRSFTPGQQAVLVRNEHYWESGLPYLERLVLTNVSDESTQVNGLISGQYDVVNGLSAASIAAVNGGGGVALISNGGTFIPFTMRADRPPFDDVRVRQAFRLLVDRDVMLKSVLEGHGIIGNDLYSNFDPVYDSSLPQRVQDVEQAKHLLKQAGREGMSIDLTTSAVGQGAIEMAEVFAQQAAAAGVKVKVRQVPVSVLYGPNYLRWEFSQDYWPYSPYFPQVATANLPASAYNETHWSNPRFFDLYRQGLATTDVGRRTELAHEMQGIYYKEGTYIIPFFSATIDGYSKRVGGAVKSKTGQSFNVYDFKSLWLT